MSLVRGQLNGLFEGNHDDTVQRTVYLPGQRDGHAGQSLVREGVPVERFVTSDELVELKG